MLSYSEVQYSIAGPDDIVLVTGANGFIGTQLIENLLARRFRRLRCFVRPTGRRAALQEVCSRYDDVRVEIVTGNLLNPEDCRKATEGAVVIFHLAAGRGEKSVPDAFMNSVVTTRNLLEATRHWSTLRRFVNVSSFAVYTNTNKPLGRTLDECCPTEVHPEMAGDAYCFAKVKQDEIVAEYGSKFGIPYVMVRPGYVFGPSKAAISGRVGISTFGIFLHLGGSNSIPLTYVDNCADAIAVAGLAMGAEGQILNVVDDQLPSSRQFLRAYKHKVRRFSSVYVPHAFSYALCWLWESYSRWSHEQLPPSFNRKRWHMYWKKTNYSNAKIKSLGWVPVVPMADGLNRYFDSCREGEAFG